MYLSGSVLCCVPKFFIHLQEIEKTLEKVKSQSYSTLISVGAQGVNLALQGAIAVSDKNMHCFVSGIWTHKYAHLHVNCVNKLSPDHFVTKCWSGDHTLA